MGSGQVSRREMLHGGVGVLLGVPGLPSLRRKKRKRPNIVVILTDDQRYDAMSRVPGSGMLDMLKTPHMDGLAEEGVSFENAFVTTSLCSPSRASILSGLTIGQHGVWRLNRDLNPGTLIFPELLRKKGYDTGFVGKWHIGTESETPNPAFTHWAAFRGQGTYFDPELNIDGQRWKRLGYVTEALTGQAIDFIRLPRDEPFFLLLSHKAPHNPCRPAPHLATLYNDVEVPLPATYLEDHGDKPSWFLTAHDHDAFRYLLYPPEKHESYVRNYCRTLVSVDEQLARLMQALRDEDLEETTAVFLLSDNGHFLGEHSLYSKMLMYEESVRIPIMARFPGEFSAGLVRKEQALNIDLAPTVLELAGIAVPPSMEGRSFLPLLRGEDIGDWRRAFRYEHFSSWGLPSFEGVYTADGLKYIRYPEWEQLFDVRTDPLEILNFAPEPLFGDLKKELMDELIELGGGGKLEPANSIPAHSEWVKQYLQSQREGG